MYQGKNVKNMGIPEEIIKLQTTQKAAVNFIIQCRLGKDPGGI
jgi:hypothetical protein